MFDNTYPRTHVVYNMFKFLFKYRITVNIYFVFYFLKYVSVALDPLFCQITLLRC